MKLNTTQKTVIIFEVRVCTGLLHHHHRPFLEKGSSKWQTGSCFDKWTGVITMLNLFKVLRLSWDNPRCVYRLGKELTESIPKKDLEVLMNKSWMWSSSTHLQAVKPTVFWAVKTEGWPGKGKRLTPSALSLWGLVGSSASTGLGSPVQERCGALETGPEEGTKTIRGLEPLFFEERLR